MEKNQKNFAETIYYNAKIYTMAENHPYGEAIAIADSKILKVGSMSDMKPHISRHTKIINLNGHVLLPGLIEGHIHLLKHGETLLQKDFRKKSKEEILKIVKQETLHLLPGEWYLNDSGWNHENWKNSEYPSKEDLDSVSNGHPVSLGRCDGHMLWVNSKALELANITENSQNPKGGEILRKKDGSLLGCLSDNACEAVAQIIPNLDEKKMEEMFLCAQENLFQYGITSVTAMNTTTHHLRVLEKLYKQGRLKLRIHAALGALPGEAEDPDCKQYYKTGPVVEAYNQHLNIRAVKFFADGSLGAHSAALTEPYIDRADYCGKLNYTEKEFFALVKEAFENNFQVITHAIGDKANHFCIETYKKVLGTPCSKDHRFRIEHFQLITPKDIQEIKRYRILPSMQGVHSIVNKEMAEKRLGSARSRMAYANGKVLKGGNIIIGGSDAPFCPVNPFLGIYASISRKDEKGVPENGWFPENCLSRMDALKSYTIWPAYGQFEEILKGSLQEGYLADFIVLDRDIMNCAEELIKDTQVLLTVSGGQEVYRSKNF